MAEAPENIDQHYLSWRSLFWHQDLALPNSLQTPVLECLRPNKQQDRNSPTHQQTGCLKPYRAHSHL